MANNPIKMSKLKQILLHLNRGLTQRDIETLLKVSRKTIRKYEQRIQQSDKSLQEVCQLSEAELEALFATAGSDQKAPASARRADFLRRVPYFKAELKRIGVTRDLLWREYRKEYSEGYSQTQFCELLRRELTICKATLLHPPCEPGELIEIDFAGDPLHYIDRDTGALIPCPVLVGVLPFSGYGYAEPLKDTTIPHLVGA